MYGCGCRVLPAFQNSALPANALGFQTGRGPASLSGSGRPCPTVCGTAPKPRCTSCAVDGSNAFPYAFESLDVPGYFALNVPSDPPTVGVRVIRGVATVQGTFVIGTANEEATGLPGGFLGLIRGEVFVRAEPLVYAHESSLYKLTQPRAIIASPGFGSLIIVGSGVVSSVEDPTTTTFEGPAVAVVTLGSAVASGAGDCAWTTFIQVGCGISQQSQEIYSDVTFDPWCSSVSSAGTCAGNGISLLVVGSAEIDYQFTATFRRLNGETLLPVPLQPDGALLASWGATGLNSAAGVSIAASLAFNLILIAINCTVVGVTSSSVWALSPDGAQILPQNTSYNALATGQLALPANVVGVRALSVRISSDGSMAFVTCNGTTADGSSLPDSIAVVYAFTRDTLPDASFGTYGISTWFDPDSVLSWVMDAVLVGGSLTFVANAAFAKATESSVVAYITPPTLTWLTAVVRTDTASPYQLGLTTQPYVVRMSNTGCPAVVSPPLACCSDPCSTFVWATALVGNVLLGDVATKPLGSTQPAGVLNAVLSTNPPRVVNGARTPALIVDAECDGWVSVDTRCAPTVLAVNGPIIVGDNDSTAPIPGTIRFSGGQFQGYNGTSWVTFGTIVG